MLHTSFCTFVGNQVIVVQIFDYLYENILVDCRITWHRNYLLYIALDSRFSKLPQKLCEFHHGTWDFRHPTLTDLLNGVLYVHSCTGSRILDILHVTWAVTQAQQLSAVALTSVLSGAAGRTLVVLFPVRTFHFISTKIEAWCRCEFAQNMLAATAIPSAPISAKYCLVDEKNEDEEQWALGSTIFFFSPPFRFC